MTSRSAAAAGGPILHAAGIAVRFGACKALDGVSLALNRGDLSGLIGPNGAGKSTLFDVIAGERRPSSGQVMLSGRAVDAEPVHLRLGKGLGRTFQIPRPFAAMSVIENVMLGGRDHVGERTWPNWFGRRHVARIEAAMFARAMQLLDFVSLGRHAHEPAGVLSGGERKLLELARVLMAEPSLILLDEPAAGVNPVLLEIIIERIAALNRQGITFLIVEHNMELIGRLCRHVYVLAAGRNLCEGSPTAVTHDSRVIDAYLGGVPA